MNKIVLIFTLFMLLMASTLDVAQARHKEKKAHPVEASNTAVQAPPPEPPQATWKTSVSAVVVALGAQDLADRLDMDNAWFGVAAGLSILFLFFVAIFVVLKVLKARRGPPVYADDHVHISAEAEATLKAKRQARRLEGMDADKAAVEKFLEGANAYFLRLQSAWDKGDIKEIRELTTPDMLAEFQSQLRHRGNSLSNTDVEFVEAELLQMENVQGEISAEVQFVGMIREENQPTVSFLEIWHVKRPPSQDRWVLADIQQIS